MATMSTRTLITLLAAGLVLAGCGRAYQPAAPAVQRAPANAASAKGVAPDHEAVLSGDIRRAKYWSADAELVMAIHATTFNTTKVSASANVFYSKEAYISGRPSVFVARHYGIRPVAQYTEVPDYSQLAGRLKPIGAYAVKAETAWRVVKGVEAQPAPSPAPVAGPAAMHDPGNAVTTKPRFIFSSRAFLIQPEAGDPAWRFYSGKDFFTINANSKVLTGPMPQINPNDRLNSGFEVDLQRAAAQWLPLGTGGDNITTEPQPTN